MKVPVYRALGCVALAIGLVGALLPLLPTTPFLIGAAYFFARSHPEWEERLLSHPRAGATIRAWRDEGAIPRGAKLLAAPPLAISAIGGWFSLPTPWAWLPAVIAAAVFLWVWTRPTA